MSVQLYEHFLTLSVGMSFLLDNNNEKRNEYLPFARNLLAYFVGNSTNTYGSTFNVYNVHNIPHLCDDAEHFQCSLNEISAFPFENKLKFIKKLVRNAHNQIAPVTKRLMEYEASESYLIMHKNPITISVKRKDSCVLLKTEQFAFCYRETR